VTAFNAAGDSVGTLQDNWKQVFVYLAWKL